jgi:hypothetical protein
MLKKRLLLIPVILIVIGLGLLSRKVSILPAATGDLLYALMMFYILRLVLIKKSAPVIGVISLVICFGIECMQLIQVPWLNEMRATLPGRLILGQGFLWTDLVAYTLGASVGVMLEKVWLFR